LATLKIVCDSGSDLTVKESDELGILRVPLYAINNEIAYRDGVDLLPSELYSHMREGAVYSTSQVSLEDFLEVFESIVSHGEDFFYIGFSSELSGTFNAGKIAAGMIAEKYPGSQALAYDTLCASLGCGMVVDSIVKLYKSGMTDPASLLKAAQHCSSLMDHIFTVDDVVYLARGGRLSKASALIAGSLDIRPIMSTAGGKLEVIKKIRGAKRVNQAMLDFVHQRAGEYQIPAFWIGHADCMDKAQALREAVLVDYPNAQVEIHSLGPVIGAHVGPGTLAIFHYNSDPLA